MRDAKFWALFVLMRALAWLPWWVLEALGWVVGQLLWWTKTRTRRITEINIERCLPDWSAQERQRLARASLLDFGEKAFEIAKVWFAPPYTAVAAIVAVEGEHLLRRELASGRGVILLGPHHGNWEMLGLFVGRFYGLTTMYLPAKDPVVDALIRGVRTRGGATVAPASAGGIRTLLKVLKQGGLVGVLPDQVPKQAGAEFAPFFGAPALTMTLTSNLLQKTGARALFGCALRVGRGGGFRIVFREPDAGLYSPDIDTSLAALNLGVEAIARECPAQYQWEYKRFKAQPEGFSRVY